MKKKETGGACLFFLHPCGKNAAPCRLGWPGANPAERIAAGSEEKARPAYEKAPRPFHRLRAFSELSGGLNPDILPWNPCTATACKFPAKNTRNFFEVLLTLFEPPAEFNADITRPAFGTHPAAILASVLLLSADR